jgi:hypothetical protein
MSERTIRYTSMILVRIYALSSTRGAPTTEGKILIAMTWHATPDNRNSNVARAGVRRFLAVIKISLK